MSLFSPRIHQSIGGRQLWQRGYCHIRPDVHILFVDQSRQDRNDYVERVMCIELSLHGVRLGRICLYHQSHPIACVRPNDHATIQLEDLRVLYDILYFGTAVFYANPIRRLSTNQDQWTHGFGRCLRSVTSKSLIGILNPVLQPIF